MIQIAKAVIKYLDDLSRIHNLENLYYYSFDEARIPVYIELQNQLNSCRKNIELKTRLHQYWLDGNAELKGRIIYYYIRHWGQIKGNGQARLNFYQNASDIDLINEGVNGISSWSKALCIHDPVKYVIYDSRVAASLNCLQIKYISNVDERRYFFIPIGQGNIITSFRENLLNNNELLQWNNIDNAYIYVEYIKLLNLCEEMSNYTRILIEMVLFQNGPMLATEQLNSRI